MSHYGLKHKVQLPFKVEQCKVSWSPKTVIIYAPDEVIDACKEWCKERVGVNGWNYYGKHRKTPCEFRFKSAEDLLAFKLTFGL